MSGSSRRWFALSVAVVAVTAGASCSSSSSKASSSAGATTTSTPDTYVRPACDARAAQDVAAAPVAGSTSDYDITSFDGTKIRAHWFPVDGAGSDGAPTVLKGPGWGLAGDVNTEGSGYGLFGDLSINSLNGEGYNVLTWDPRGFGASEGVVETNSPDFEGRDVQQLIDWVATLPGVQLDTTNDPRMGMVGASYGGGIQLTVASIDCRVDAIVPQLAWNSLGTSLYKNDTAKTGWGNLLYGVAGQHELDPHITSAHTESNASGVISDDDVEWFVSRGPGDAVADITAPTLFEQGTIDTLFTLDEAVANYRILKDKGVPTAMLWMCSGHGVCLTEAGDEQLAGRAALAWLDRYVKDDTSVEVGPEFRYVDQNGVGHEASAYPPSAGDPVVATGEGLLALAAEGGSGPAVATGDAGSLGALALPITPGPAKNAVEVPITFAESTAVLGAPELTLRFSGTTPPGERPTRVFAQLVDDATDIVLGTQVTPIELTLDGNEHTVTVPLETVAFAAKAGTSVTLQLVATTVAYAQPRLGGEVDFGAIDISVPTASANTAG